MKKYNATSSSYFVNLVCLPFLIAGILLNQNGENIPFMSFVILTLGALSVLRVRRNWCLFLIYALILYCNYSILITMYLTDDLQASKSMFMTYKYSGIAVSGINIMGIFTYMMLCAAPEVKSQHSSQNILIGNKYNALIVIALSVLLILI